MDYQDHNRLKEIYLYVTNKCGSNNIIDFHKLFKTLYVADKYHIADYGSRITSDSYIKMEYGPVPSILYNLLKAITISENTLDKHALDSFSDDFEAVYSTVIKAKRSSNAEYISEAEKDSLDKAIKIIKPLSFNSRTALTHDAAYESARLNRSMKEEEIIAASTDDPNVIEFALEQLQNNRLLSELA